MKFIYLFLLGFILLNSTSVISQEYNIEIEDKLEANRLLIYAVNKNLIDLDVSIEVEGTGFRSRGGRQLVYRVPATSKVNISTLIVERGKQAMYTYQLTVSDSLSRRARIMPFELVKIEPKKPISLFTPEKCSTLCDSLISALDNSPYNYRLTKISDDENIKSQLEKSLVGGAERLAGMENPIVMLGGKMYVQIETYEDLMARMEEEE